MKNTYRLCIGIIIIALLCSLIPQQTVAAAPNQSEELEKEVVLLADKPGGSVSFYRDPTDSDPYIEIEDNTYATLLDQIEEYFFVMIHNPGHQESEEVLTGYVKSIHVVPVTEADEHKKSRALHEESETPQEDSDEPLNESVTSSEEVKKENLAESPSKEKNSTEESANIHSPKAENTVAFQKGAPSAYSSSVSPDAALKGVAVKKRTNVYADIEKSKVLKSYQSGHILKFRTYDANWYAATVIVNGKAESGFIEKNDVDPLVEQQQTKRGYATANIVHVYQLPDKKSRVLKSYQQGRQLKYETLSTEWHRATVILNGKAHKGYIHVSDVGDHLPAPSAVKGFAKASPTVVYSSRSTRSKQLKSYPAGRIIKYRPYDKHWHEATVYLKGIAHKGFIRTSDVENIQPSNTVLRGVAKQAPTRVYQYASTISKTLKSYSQGSILKYKPISGNWYEATVYITGKATKGYIHKNHVENVINSQTTLQGAALKSPTRVYQRASTNSKTLKSYVLGNRLIYKTFTSNWYEATVYINGKATTGYIYKNDAGSLSGRTIVLDPGHGGSDPGAIASGIIEKNINLDIALRTKTLLENAGAKVIMTRTRDEFISLPERAAIGNNSGADIFISIHGNNFNGSAHGVETFWHNKYEKIQSEKLATVLQNRVVQQMNMSYRRVDLGNFHVIRETNIPSALVETGFLDHPGDAAKLKHSSYRQRAAQGILLGVYDYFK